MSISKLFNNSSSFFLTGLVTVLISSILLSIFFNTSNTDILEHNLYFLIFGVFVEEGTKFITLKFLFSNLLETPSLKNSLYLISSLSFATGFVLPEYIFIYYFKKTSLTLDLYIIFPAIIHLISALLIIKGISRQKSNTYLSTNTLPYLILAFLIHLCYNFIVYKML